jgi:hypothetical protein
VLLSKEKKEEEEKRMTENKNPPQAPNTPNH